MKLSHHACRSSGVSYPYQLHSPVEEAEKRPPHSRPSDFRKTSSGLSAEPSAPDDLEVVYDTAGGTSIADVVGDFVISSADTIACPQIKNVAGAAASTMVNKAVVLDNTGSNYTGNATGDTTLTVVCTYRVHDAGLA